jgi:hypothetical protein
VILTKGKIRDPKIKSNSRRFDRVPAGKRARSWPTSLKVNCVAAIFISERLVLSKSWTSDAGHIGDQNIITSLITSLITVVEIKVSKKVVISLECIVLLNLQLAAIHFSDSKMKRQLGIFVYFSACV